MSDDETWRLVHITDGGNRNILREGVLANIRHDVLRGLKDTIDEGRLLLETEDDNDA